MLDIEEDMEEKMKTIGFVEKSKLNNALLVLNL